MKASDDAPGQDPRTKKPYRSPRLFVYGDFRELTAAKGGAEFDGVGKPSTRSVGVPG